MYINYEKCLVGFLDVMGFTDLLRNTPKNRMKLGDYFKEIDTATLDPVDGGIGIQVIAISDSVIYSVPMTGNELEDITRAAKFAEILANLQFRLASKHSIWTRGAISIGDLHMDMKSLFIVGQAFVDAYSLEKSANYPRIIIDPKVFKHFKKSAHEFCFDMKIYINGPILDFTPNSPSSLSPWPNDFVQIDWLRIALDGDFDEEDSEDVRYQHFFLREFFADLSERQHENADLFRKSQMLIRYLQQSLFLYKVEGGSSDKAHVIEITSQLTELTGVDLSRIRYNLVGR